MKSLSWMALSLFLVCLIASGLLSRVYTVTQVQIDKQITESTLKRLNELLPNTHTFKEIIPDTLWVGYDELMQKIGIIFKVAPAGYGGAVPILVGYGADEQVKKIYISSASEGLKETPGLGTKVREKSFINQFENKTYPELKLSKDGGKIQAVTAATISSRAVINGIREGIENYKKYLFPETITQFQCDSTLSEKTLSRLSLLLPQAKVFKNIIPDTLWVGCDNQNQQVGIVFQVAPQGYAGLIPIYVGYDKELQITKIYIASPSEGLKETPGFGLEIRTDSFRNQFSGKNSENLKFTKQGGTIQAISGATISSLAVLSGIQQGIQKYEKYLQTDTLK